MDRAVARSPTHVAIEPRHEWGTRFSGDEDGRRLHEDSSTGGVWHGKRSGIRAVEAEGRVQELAGDQLACWLQSRGCGERRQDGLSCRSGGPEQAGRDGGEG